MRQDLLPLFPLAVVLLPRGTLPLHIFEDRYKEMIGLVLETGAEFGVVLAAKEGIARVGCSASVEEVSQRYPDGRLDIVTLGRQRFAIHDLDQEKAYLRATVEFFDDEEEEGASADLRGRALRAWSALPGEETPPDADDPLLSFKLAQRLQDLEFRQTLLMSRSEPDRLRRIIRFAPEYAVQLKRVEHLKEVAPRNGFGHLDPGKDTEA